MTVSRVVVALVGGLSTACGPPKKVNSFDVQPRTACPGDDVTLSWDVTGTTTLATVPSASAVTEPDPNVIAAAEQPVAPKLTKSVPIKETTWYVIRAVDAHQAKDPWLGKHPVDVPVSDERRGGDSTCDGTTCRASFRVSSKNTGARVTRIYKPEITSGGKPVTGQVCITHAPMQKRCLAADQSIDDVAPLPLEGDWTLETTFPEKPATPPGLRVTLHIGCFH